MSISSCCLRTFKWDGTPTCTISKLNNNTTYITGTKISSEVFLIHDLLGYTFPNIRLLADHYASEANVTVYVPDFFGGSPLSFEPLLNGRWDEISLPGFMAKNSCKIREPEIFDCARALKDKYEKVGAVGFCHGGWAVFRLSAKEHQTPLVDCITAGHPSLLRYRRGSNARTNLGS